MFIIFRKRNFLFYNIFYLRFHFMNFEYIYLFLYLRGNLSILKHLCWFRWMIISCFWCSLCIFQKKWKKVSVNEHFKLLFWIILGKPLNLMKKILQLILYLNQVLLNGVLNTTKRQVRLFIKDLILFATIFGTATYYNLKKNIVCYCTVFLCLS